MSFTDDNKRLIVEALEIAAEDRRYLAKYEKGEDKQELLQQAVMFENMARRPELQDRRMYLMRVVAGGLEFDHGIAPSLAVAEQEKKRLHGRPTTSVVHIIPLPEIHDEKPKPS